MEYAAHTTLPAKQDAPNLHLLAFNLKGYRGYALAAPLRGTSYVEKIFRHANAADSFFECRTRLLLERQSAAQTAAQHTAKHRERLAGRYSGRSELAVAAQSGAGSGKH